MFVFPSIFLVTLFELSFLQLSQYHDLTSPTEGPNPQHNDDFDPDDDPAMILGLRNLSLSTSQGYNLSAEVEAYFLDTHESDSLTFWQVNLFFDTF